jgi:hypothetical protein
LYAVETNRFGKIEDRKWIRFFFKINKLENLNIKAKIVS